MTAALIATAGLIGACGEQPTAPPTSRDEPVRRAAFRALLARAFLATCPGAAARAEAQRQAARHGELHRLGERKGAGHALWLGANDFNALAGHGARPACAAGEGAWRSALADYGARLDALAGRLTEYRP